MTHDPDEAEGDDFYNAALAIAAEHLPPANWQCPDCDTWNGNQDHTCMACDHHR